MKKIPFVFGFVFCLFELTHLAGQMPSEPLTDSRDGQVYPTVRIGEQVWMARNLSFDNGSLTCYDQDPENCARYGALYTWEEAHEGCPAGWHLPAKSEWETLSEYLGRAGAGQKLKAAPHDPLPWDGNNETGFSALPAGAGNGEGFHRMDAWALFWSSTEYNDERAWFSQLDGFWYQAPPKYTKLYVGNYYLKTNQFSVRCIKDQN